MSLSAELPNELMAYPLSRGALSMKGEVAPITCLIGSATVDFSLYADTHFT